MLISRMETSVIRWITTLIAACHSFLEGGKRPADDTAAFDELSPSPSGEKMATKPKDFAEEITFLLGVLFIALMILLSLALPAIVMTGLCLLLIERLTRYRTGMAGKSLAS